MIGLLCATALTMCYSTYAKKSTHEASTEVKRNNKTKPAICNSRLTDFAIFGSGLYSTDIFHRQLDEFIGQCIDKTLNEKIVRKINNFYQKNGYIYSFVSDIKRVGTKLHITVLEGHIKEVAYEESFESPQLKEYAKKLTEIKPFNKNIASRYMALIRRLPGMVDKVKFTPLVIPFDQVDPKNPATVDLVIENYFYRVSGFINYDNRYKDLRSDALVPTGADSIYTRHKGQNFTTLSANINNPFSLGGQINTAVITSLSHEDNNFFIAYKQPINSHGTTALMSASSRLIKFPIKQETKSIEAGFLHPLFLNLSQSLDLTIKANQYSTRNQYKLKSDSFDSFRVKKLIFGAAYSLKDKFSGRHHYSINYHKSIHINQEKLKSSSHDQSFNKYLADANIAYPFFCTNCTFTFNASGQYSKNNLFSTEVFYPNLYNGSRGFDDSELYGDKGLSSSIELSKYIPIEEHVTFQGFRIYTYFDRSKFWNNIDSSLKPKSAKIASYGLGTDIYVYSNLVFNLEYSKPISKSVQSNLFKSDKKPGSRIYFGIRYDFGF